MGFFTAIFGAIADAIQWFTGYAQRKIGRQQQQNDDAKKTIEQDEAEKSDAAQHIDASNELSKHDF